MLQLSQFFDETKFDFANQQAKTKACEKKIDVNPVLADAMADLGFSVLTEDKELAGFFGVQPISWESSCKIGLMKDEILLYVIETDDDVIISAEPCAMNVKGNHVAELVFSERVWKERFPKMPFAKEIVQAVANHFLGYPLWDAFS